MYLSNSAIFHKDNDIRLDKSFLLEKRDMVKKAELNVLNMELVT